MFFHIYTIVFNPFWLPRWLSGKESSCNAGATGDSGLIPGSGRSPEGGHSNPLQCSCVKNPMDRGAWIHKVDKSLTRLKQLSLRALAYLFTVTVSPVCSINFSIPWNSIIIASLIYIISWKMTMERVVLLKSMLKGFRILKQVTKS